jgi:hypothetical protein
MGLPSRNPLPQGQLGISRHRQGKSSRIPQLIRQYPSSPSKARSRPESGSSVRNSTPTPTATGTASRWTRAWRNPFARHSGQLQKRTAPRRGSPALRMHSLPTYQHRRFKRSERAWYCPRKRRLLCARRHESCRPRFRWIRASLPLAEPDASRPHAEREGPAVAPQRVPVLP